MCLKKLQIYDVGIHYIKQIFANQTFNKTSRCTTFINRCRQYAIVTRFKRCWLSSFTRTGNQQPAHCEILHGKRSKTTKRPCAFAGILNPVRRFIKTDPLDDRSRHGRPFLISTSYYECQRYLSIIFWTTTFFLLLKK